MLLNTTVLFFSMMMYYLFNWRHIILLILSFHLKFGVVIACAQKNLGPAGITAIIIREDLLGKPSPLCPQVFDYTLFTQENSLLNTPPTLMWVCKFWAYLYESIFYNFNDSNRVYIFSLVLLWVKNQGGLVGMEANSKAKSELLYKCIENSQGFYSCPVAKDSRSRITVPFCLSAGAEADKQFLKEAQDLGFLQLKGHRYSYYIIVFVFHIVSNEIISYSFIICLLTDW